MNEFSDYMKSRSTSQIAENVEIFESDKKQYNSITERLEGGEDIDLTSLLPKSSWEKI